jgi:hypothetical protein
MMQSVQIIIERLKTHPEDFFGELSEQKGLGIKYPKFHEYTNKIDDLLVGKTEHPDRLWYLEPEEKEALLAAYKEARRARFEAKVLHTLLSRQEPEEPPKLKFNTQGRYAMHTGTPGVIAQEIGPVIDPWANAPVKNEGGPV